MGESIREYSGRAFSSEEIALIQWTVKTYPGLSRTELAKTVCEFLGWRQTTGRPKTQQCGSLLCLLESEGLIELPASTNRGTKKAAGRGESTALNKRAEAGQTETQGLADGACGNRNYTPTVTECGAIDLSIPQTKEDHARWRRYMGEYHALGYVSQFGAQLRYFIRSEGQELGCLQFSASAWALAARDKWIGWGVADKKARLHLVINNSRFLVLPWVRIRNMASRALGRAARQIRKDWLAAYCYEPVLLETFVETEKYRATCYRAANWMRLGSTQGRGRQDTHHRKPLAEKDIYVYPLRSDFREILKGEKPFKAVSPDE